MNYRVRVDNTKLQKFCSYCGDYIDIVYKNNIVFLCSEMSDIYVHCVLQVLDGDSNDISIRMPKVFFQKLSSESVIDFIIKSDTVKTLFYNKDMELMYKISTRRQTGFIDYEEKLKIIEESGNYEGYTISKVSNLIRTLIRLNTEFYSLDGIAYGMFERCFIFNKSDLPNFGLSVYTMKKLIADAYLLTFIRQYIYYNIEDYDIHVITSKLRVPMDCDLHRILTIKYRYKIKTDMTSLNSINGRLTFDKGVECKVDFNENFVVLRDDMKEVKASIVIKEKISANKDSKENTDDNDLIDLNAFTSIIDKDEELKREKVPVFSIPKWVLNSIPSSGDSTFNLCKDFIIMSFKGGKILFPRGSVNE
jgi:hypothetical protein